MTDGPAPAAERRSRLLGIKLRALVAEHLGRHALRSPTPRSSRAARRSCDDGAAWVLIDGPAARSLGGALAWALRHGATLVGPGRRARHRVCSPDGPNASGSRSACGSPQDRVLLAAVSEPLAPPRPAPDAHLALIAVIEAAGAAPNVEHGVVFGEVRGLEVCRVVDQPDDRALRRRVRGRPRGARVRHGGRVRRRPARGRRRGERSRGVPSVARRHPDGRGTRNGRGVRAVRSVARTRRNIR